MRKICDRVKCFVKLSWLSDDEKKTNESKMKMKISKQWKQINCIRFLMDFRVEKIHFRKEKSSCQSVNLNVEKKTKLKLIEHHQLDMCQWIINYSVFIGHAQIALLSTLCADFRLFCFFPSFFVFFSFHFLWWLFFFSSNPLLVIVNVFMDE